MLGRIELPDEPIFLARLSAAPCAVAAEGRVFIAREEGKVSVKAAGRWEVERVNDLGEGVFATPVLSRGVIYVRTEEALYAFGSPSERASANHSVGCALQIMGRTARTRPAWRHSFSVAKKPFGYAM